MKCALRCIESVVVFIGISVAACYVYVFTGGEQSFLVLSTSPISRTIECDGGGLIYYSTWSSVGVTRSEVVPAFPRWNVSNRTLLGVGVTSEVTREADGSEEACWSKVIEARKVVIPLLHVWTVPLLALVLIVPQIASFFRRRGTRRADPVCERCKYDLRATPARCPECGLKR